MKITKENLQLSGKGAIVTQELLYENIKLVTHETEFHEVVAIEDEIHTRIGWIIPNSFEILADFTTHTKNGMRGKSTHDRIERALVVDGQEMLDQLLPKDLIDVDITESSIILDTMFSDNSLNKGNINISNMEKDDGLIVISPHSKYVFVQTENSSVRVHGEDGVYVLKRGDDKDKLVIIDQDEGINVWGDKNVSIGPGGMIIDGKPFDIGAIVDNALKGIAPALAGLGAFGAMGASFGRMGSFDFDDHFDIHSDGDFDFKMEKFEKKMEKFGKKMEKMGEKFAKNFGKNFGKNFATNFNFHPEDDIDTDFSDAFDVDVDY